MPRDRGSVADRAHYAVWFRPHQFDGSPSSSVHPGPAPAARLPRLVRQCGELYRSRPGPVYRGICTGFRDDGSATFANEKRLDTNRAPAALAMAVTENSLYAGALRRSQGQLNSVLLERLAHLARQMEARGGALRCGPFQALALRRSRVHRFAPCDARVLSQGGYALLSGPPAHPGGSDGAEPIEWARHRAPPVENP